MKTKKEILSDCYFDGLSVVCRNPKSLKDNFYSQDELKEIKDLLLDIDEKLYLILTYKKNKYETL